MQKINSAQFKEQVMSSKIPVLVDFFATWCGPCQMQTPVLEELSSHWEGKVKFVKVDVDEEGQLAGQFQVMSIPTLVIFKDGKATSQLIGFQSKEKLESILQQL